MAGMTLVNSKAFNQSKFCGIHGGMPKVAAIFAMGTLILTACGCGEPYRAEAQQYLAIAQDLLIDKGVCSNVHDCQRKELLFWEGGEVSLGFVRWGGVSINLYGTQDPAVVEALVAKFKEVQAQQPTPQVTLTVYSSKRSLPKVMFREVVLK